MNETQTAEPTTNRPKPKRRWVRRLLGVLLGLIVGVLIAEGAFWLRDDGAFPHVNFYQPDDELGVRLIPGATMRFGIHDNPRADIQVNSQGYRGAEWADAENEILVVGDSQVFGLGVGDLETMAAQLGELTGRHVINGGVPTYGPQEYTAVVRELMETRDIATVVYVVNMSNDFFEASRPNRGRHAVWDGWAVRAEFAPETIHQFPGRELLYRHSHAFYAARRWMNQSLPEATAVPSEGGWEDLVGESVAARERLDDATAAEEAARRVELIRVDQAVAEVDRALRDELATNLDYEHEEQRTALDIAAGHPGDIVYEGDAEEARAIGLTAALIRRAVRVRAQLIREQAADDAGVAAVSARSEQVREQQARLRAELGRRGADLVTTSVDGELRELQALCEARGAELLVVALPMDVLVSADEWAKYDTEPVDMEPTRVLLQDLVASAESLGARGLDGTDALRAAEPGAFLNGDLHMTAKGQRALAEAVAARLAEPPPMREPLSGMPEGRSAMPTYREWLHTPEVTVRGSSAARCETVVVREWLRLTCLPARGSRPTHITNISGTRGEHTLFVSEDASDLVVPLIPGTLVRADFHWTDRTQTLQVDWQDDEPTMRFTEAREAEYPERALSNAAERVCACHHEVHRERRCRRDQFSDSDCDQLVCTHAFGTPTDACLEAYADDCAGLLRCIQGDPLSPPGCSEGDVVATGTGQCFAVCDDAHPCASGECQPWNGAMICRP